MNNTERVIKENIKLINRIPREYIILFNELKSYDKKCFGTTFKIVQGITRYNNIKISTAYRFINILEYYKLINEVTYKTGIKWYKISDDLDLFDKLINFLYICNNNITVQQYSRIKKLKNIQDGIKC